MRPRWPDSQIQHSSPSVLLKCCQVRGFSFCPHLSLLRGSSLHSLRFSSTSVSDPGQAEPLFYHVGYVDEQPFVSFDGATKRMLPLVPWVEEVGKDIPLFWDIMMSQGAQHVEAELREYLATLLNLYNHSRTGLHTLQVTNGCQVGEDGRLEAGYVQYGYDGEDFLSFDNENLTWSAAVPQAMKKQMESDGNHRQNFKDYVEVDCVQWLWQYLQYGKETLQRKVPPTVKMARRKNQDGNETLLCRAYGFYPKEIEVTWKKDGVQQQDTLSGGVVPNSDWTYHKWLSIDVDPKDRDHYQCHVEHDGLREPLDLAWEEPASLANMELIVGVLVRVLPTAVLVGGVIYYTIKDHRAKGDYEAPAGAV